MKARLNFEQVCGLAEEAFLKNIQQPTMVMVQAGEKVCMLAVPNLPQEIEARLTTFREVGGVIHRETSMYGEFVSAALVAEAWSVQTTPDKVKDLGNLHEHPDRVKTLLVLHYEFETGERHYRSYSIIQDSQHIDLVQEHDFVDNKDGRLNLPYMDALLEGLRSGNVNEDFGGVVYRDKRDIASEQMPDAIQELSEVPEKIVESVSEDIVASRFLLDIAREAARLAGLDSDAITPEILADALENLVRRD